MVDILSANETNPLQPGSVVVLKQSNAPSDVWVSWANGSSLTGHIIGVLQATAYPGNFANVVTVGRVPYQTFNIAAGNESPIIAGNTPVRGTVGTIIGYADPSGECFITPSFVGSGSAFNLPGSPNQVYATVSGPATAWVTVGGDINVSANASTWNVVSLSGASGTTTQKSNINPSTDNTYSHGTNAVRLASVSALSHSVYAAANDNNPTAKLSTGALSFGPGANAAPNIRLSYLFGVLAIDNGGSGGIAVTPTTDGTGTLGTNSARWGNTSAVNYAVYVAQSDSKPGTTLTAGTLTFGAGGSNALDTRIRRTAANTIVLDNAANGPVAVLPGADNTGSFGVNTSRWQAIVSQAFAGYNNTADGNAALVLTPGNGLQLGAGNATQDIRLYRTGASAVTLDNGSNGAAAFSIPTAVTVNGADASFGVPLGGLTSANTPFVYQNVTINVNQAANTNYTLTNSQYTAPQQILTGNITGNTTATIIYPQVRALYYVDAANVNIVALSNLVHQVGVGTKKVVWNSGSSTTPNKYALYVDGANSVYYVNFA